MIQLKDKAPIEDKHQAILDTTLRLISERGFHDTPMSLIAKEAGVAAGTIYRYFENKDALINELFLNLKTRMMEAGNQGIDPAAPPKEQLSRMWLNYFNFCIQNPDAMRFIEQFHNSPFQTDEMTAIIDKLHKPTRELFREYVRRGVIRDIPFEMFLVFVYDLIVAFAKRQLSGKLVMDKQMLNLAVETSWGIIKGPEAE